MNGPHDVGGLHGFGPVQPDPDEPVLHLYAEGTSSEDSEALAAELQAHVEEIVQGDDRRPRILEKASS